jgi:hypothetical protein
VNLLACPPEVCPDSYPELVVIEACYDSNAIWTDLGGDGCDWYGLGTNASTCGDYNTSDFNANDMCCACGGGSSTPVRFSMECQSTNFEATDNGNDGCDWYERRNRSERCGDYDDADFDANSMCCACGGGRDVPVFGRS